MRLREGILLHIPVGIAIVFLCWLSPILALAFTGGFLAYELNEDMHLKDHAWIDIRGCLWGIVLGAVGWFAYNIVCPG